MAVLGKKINWVHAILLLGTPCLAFYGILTTQLHSHTLLWSIIYYFVTGLGITAGYHRLWSHRAYNAHWPLRLYFALAGAGAMEGSIWWWSRDHRTHHRYTDTEKDPYNAQRGFWYSHMGWMLLRKDGKAIGHVPTSDLWADWIVRMQHQWYVVLGPLMAFVVPTLVAGYGWQDWRGGFFYAAILRLLFVHHATFSVNSVAHLLGTTSYDDKHTPRDHFLTALITLGEGYHNFHHEFPQDYRNALKIYQYDPTKWLILLLRFTGLAYNLKRFPANEIRKGHLSMASKKINQQMQELDWGVPLDQLPKWTWTEFQQQLKHYDALIVVDGVVYNVTDFIEEHPGGPNILRTMIGKDATEAFNGSIYNHSNAARNLATSMHIATIVKHQ